MNGTEDPGETKLQRKRVRDQEGADATSDKRTVEEGMSWWTCLMLGLPYEYTKPHITKKTSTSRSKETSN